MLARITLAALFLFAALAASPPLGLAADSTGTASSKSQEEIATKPIVTPQESECLKARLELCQRDYQQCKEDNAKTYGLSYNDCYVQKMGCLKDCLSDYDYCKEDCTAHYVSGCRKKCREARNRCDDACEKQGDDCTRQVASGKPIKPPQSDCEKLREDCRKIAKESCVRESLNPGSKY